MARRSTVTIAQPLATNRTEVCRSADKVDSRQRRTADIDRDVPGDEEPLLVNDSLDLTAILNR